MSKRFIELDSLRGIAAISVVMSHFFLVIPNFYLTNNFKNTPLHIFWAGHEAVILFFLLSGFVLALPYTEKKNPIYKFYMIKRICRIYIPYILSILIGLIFILLISRDGVDNLTSWFHRTTSIAPINFKTILEHVIFIGDYNNVQINFVIWSLIHELRISIIFPLLMLLVMKLNWKLNVIICMFFSILYHAIEVVLNYQGYSDLFYSSFHRTIHYTGIFIIGALISKYRNLVVDLWVGQRFFIKVTIMMVGVLSYTYSWWFFPNVNIIHLEIINDWFIACGGCIFIVCTISSGYLRKILSRKSILFFGKISYSLYLFHGIVLINMIYTLYGSIPYLALLVVALFTSIMVATISYYFIELPSIILGQKFIKLILLKKANSIKKVG